MAFINWNDSLSVNVVVIDLQHKKLIAMINDLAEAMKQGKGKDIVGKIIYRLFNYTATHFSNEEKYFDQFNYPETATHKKAHDGFVKKITDFKQGFDEDRILLSLEIMNFLKDWLVKHIQGTDKKYSSFFNEKGLK